MGANCKQADISPSSSLGSCALNSSLLRSSTCQGTVQAIALRRNHVSLSSPQWVAPAKVPVSPLAETRRDSRAGEGQGQHGDLPK